jgi:hypothetical protein
MTEAPQLFDLSESAVLRIARAVVELQAQQSAPKTGQILTRAEARAYVKRKSEAAFCEWCKRWHVHPFARGRYSKAHLDRA